MSGNGLPPGWEWVELGKLVRPTRPRVRPTDYPNLPFIGMEHIEAQTMRLLGSKPASEMKSSAVHFESRDVLYGRLRPYLNKVFRPDFEGLCSAEFIVLPPSDFVESAYLQYFLNSSEFVRFASGINTGDRPRVDFDQLADHPVPVPPPSEQRAIVDEIEKQFTRIDAAGESLRTVEEKLARFRLGGLLATLGGQDPVRPLGELLLSLRNGLFVSRPAADPPGVPIFRISAVRPMSLDAQDVRYAAVNPSEVSGYFVEEGDLLFTRYSGNPQFVGACARVPRLREPTLHPDKLIRAVVDASEADPSYLELALSVGQARRAIERRLKTTAGQVGIAGAQLKTVPVPVPPLDVQRKVASAASKHTSVADSLASELRASQLRAVALRQGILRDAFAGRLFGRSLFDAATSGPRQQVKA